MVERFLPQKRLFIEIITLLLSVIIVVFVTIYTILMANTNRMLEEQKIEDSLLLADSVSRNIDKYQEKVITIFINILFSSSSVDLNQENLSYFFKNFIGYNYDTIRTIYFMTDRDTIISSNPALDNLNKEPIKELYDRAFDRRGYTIWSGPYESPVQMTQTIGVVKPVLDKNGVTMGVLIAEVNIDDLKKELTYLINSEYQSVLIFSGDTYLMGDNERTLIAGRETVPYEAKSLLLGLKQGGNSISLNGRDIIAVKNDNNTLSWDVILLTDRNIYYDKIAGLQRTIVLYIVLGLFILSIAMLMVSRMISRPIREMADHMDSFDDDRMLSNLFENSRSDELGVLAESYNNLIRRIDALMKSQVEIEQRKKAIEQKMLISQIKPHFLYNTLVCIISLSQKEEHEKIEETIRSLLLLLTFSIDKKEECITLYEEIEILRSYVYIQKIRYGDSFSFDVEIDREAYDAIIPKLLLQPLIENAIYHGILGREDGRIKVRISCRNGRVTIELDDNGVGMGSDKIRDILASRRTGGGEDIPWENNRHGLGMVNVMERLNLYYGDKCLFQIESEYNLGTRIRITFPMETEE